MTTQCSQYDRLVPRCALLGDLCHCMTLQFWSQVTSTSSSKLPHWPYLSTTKHVSNLKKTLPYHQNVSSLDAGCFGSCLREEINCFKFLEPMKLVLLLSPASLGRYWPHIIFNYTILVLFFNSRFFELYFLFLLHPKMNILNICNRI